MQTQQDPQPFSLAASLVAESKTLFLHLGCCDHRVCKSGSPLLAYRGVFL